MDILDFPLYNLLISLHNQSLCLLEMRICRRSDKLLFPPGTGEEKREILFIEQIC
jgi:hypothetical protein